MHVGRGVGGERRRMIDHQTEYEKEEWSPPSSQKMGESPARRDRTNFSLLLLPSQSVNSAHSPCGVLLQETAGKGQGSR